jgi:osmotically inducible protein OsmC
MAIRTATAEWTGDFESGNGTFEGASGQVGGAYSAESRFGESGGTNPEELVAAAHASCFSMALALALVQGGNTPEAVRTEARVQILKDGDGFAIKKIDLVCVARVPGIEDGAFQAAAEGAKEGCPISKALAAVPEINLDAKLES